MGTRNKERRAAKAKRRAQEQARRSSDNGRRHHDRGWHEPLFTPGERIRSLIEAAGAAAGAGDDAFVAQAIASLEAADVRLVDRQSEGAVLSLVALLWDHGWQPAELIRHARRADARAGRLVAMAVSADHAHRAPSTLHPRWVAQIEALALPTVDGLTGWLTTFTVQEELGRWATISTVVRAVEALGGAGPLPTLIPPPGATRGAVADDPDVVVDDPVLVRVRALLAQAESTTFEAEAEAFTAKAQELMARHAIDAAVLWAKSARDERPTTIRVPIDDPYADIKSLLMQRVAKHSRCKAVYHPRCGLGSILGFASDVAATEMLFTSLLVQSQAALRSEATKAGPGGRTRSRSFRSSFLLSFTHRIDHRLAVINAAVERGAEGGVDGSLLPVLAARDSAVDDAVNEMFGELQSSIVRGGSDAAGWVRGQLAADLAQLNFGDLDDTDGDDAAAPALALGT